MRDASISVTSRTLAVLLLTLGCGGPNYGATDLAAHATALPVRYVAGRFFARPVTTGGDTLDLFTDTGGGLWLAGPVVERLQLPTQLAMIRNGRDTTYAAHLPAFQSDATIPPPLGSPGGRLNIMTARDLAEHGNDMPSMAHWSGMLGQAWFAGRVWTFDYPNGQLWLHAPDDTLPRDPEHTVPLGFQDDTGAVHGVNFPRIRALVDGDSLDLLFDTGASTTLTDSALALLGDAGPAERATSFIVQSVFDRWHTGHPDWRVIEHAEARSGMPMIEVPHVSVGGQTVGPVWFTMRPDANFHDWMSQWMDRRIDGALGGSALQYLRVTVDYPHSVAVFEQP
jgi:hypothetical protein